MGECRKPADSHLLTFVSVLSGHLTENDSANRACRPMYVQLRSMVLGIASATVLSTVPALAESRDQDAVRHAVERGEIRPLTDILNAVRGKLPGEVVGVEIESKKGRWLYEFRVLDGKGRLFEVYVDAQSGEIDRTEEK
jgi:uncharacterized membrane protein YkoI